MRNQLINVKEGLIRLIATPKLAAKAAREPMDRREFLAVAGLGTLSALGITSTSVESQAREKPSGVIFRHNPETGEFEEEKSEEEVTIYPEKERKVSPDERENDTFEFQELEIEDLRDYRNNPGIYQKEEPDEVTLARLIYAEARSEWRNPDILNHKGSSVLNRLGRKKPAIEEVIFQRGQYEALSDGNRKYFDNPSKFIETSEIDKRSWKSCYRVAKNLIENGPEYRTEFTILQKKGEPLPEKSNKPSRSWIKKVLNLEF